jgi:two-component system phosphate regulon sensor histidine kinase PhoR
MNMSRPFLPMLWFFRKTDEDPVAPANVAGHEAEAALVTGLVAALPDPVIVVDRHAMVIAANAHARAALDTDPVGFHLSGSIRAPAVLEAVSAAISGTVPRNVEYELRVPVPRSFDVIVSPLAKAKGDGPAALLVFKDLTREQQIERMRADFVANASHELRTPLASISGFIETMQGAARNDEVARGKFLGLMRQQAERMRRLIDDLLSLSRIEINEHVRPTASADLAQVARLARDSLAGLAQELGCEVRVNIAGPLAVVGDADELQQVVQNLVENALKYASSGKLVEIDGSRVNGHAELTVRDHGPGIAPEHIPRLTERFYRVSVQESRMRGGTGLGLAIVKHILNRHRGRLAVTSEIGRGSCFTIRLPSGKT